MTLPIIDFADYRAGAPGSLERTAEHIGRALSQAGFYAAVNHGLDWSKVERVFAQARRYHALPIEAKQATPFSGAYTGYLGANKHVLRTSQVNRNTQGDLNEAFFVERETPPEESSSELAAHFEPANQWPSGLPGFREAVLDYYRAAEHFARSLLPLYAVALGLSGTWFDSAFNWPQASLRLTRYPPGQRATNQFGIAPHTDAGFLTVLPQSEVTGLHIRLPNEGWVTAPRVEQGLFINSGDMLKRWTNDRWLSTQHMAVNDADEDRYAAVFFFSPTLDFEMACIPTCQDEGNPPRYEPISYRQYRAWFMDSNYRADEPPRAQVEPVGVDR